MKSSDADRQEPMDDVDWALLDDIRDLYGQADPMPADLPQRIIGFSAAIRGLEAELARLAADAPEPAGVRGTEHSRTVTFDSDSLTIMIRIDPNADGTVRIDGWLAPPQRREIEMQITADTRCVTSDDQGRFAFVSLPPGTARLVVKAADGALGGSGPAVVTPPLVL